MKKCFNKKINAWTTRWGDEIWFAKVWCSVYLGGLREVSDAGRDHSEADEEDAGAPPSTPAPWESLRVQTSLPGTPRVSGRLEDVPDSVQETCQVTQDTWDALADLVVSRYSEQVPSYEQSMLAVSRRIRNKSQPPPLPLTSSSLIRRSCSRPRTPSGLPPFQTNYSTPGAYTKMFDHKSTPSRGL